MAGTDSRVTTGYSRLVTDTLISQLAYPQWADKRTAQQISQTATAVIASDNVAFRPGNAWTLAMLREDLQRIIHTDDEGAAVGAADVTLATGWEVVNTYRRPDDLPGIGGTGSLIDTGSPAFIKRPTAGGTWALFLEDDLAAVPKPAMPTEDITLDRVLSGNATYPENCGFALAFNTPGEQDMPDNLLRLYFGGPAAGIKPQGKRGGEFALTFRGNGQAYLHEYTEAGTWAKRSIVPWAQPSKAGNLQHYAVWMLPYGRDRIAFSSSAMDGVLPASGGFTVMGLLANVSGAMLGKANAVRAQGFYLNSVAETGYTAGVSMTGPGPIRMDVRRDLRTLVKITRLRPEAQGTLVDTPRFVAFPVPAGSPITIDIDAYIPAGTEIEIKLFTVADGECLPVGAPTARRRIFEAQAGIQGYYAAFVFKSDEDRKYTPVLYGYTMSTPARYVSRTPAAASWICQGFSITGPDITPEHDSASVRMEDPLDTAAGPFRLRARIPAQIRLYADNGDLATIAFDGEIAQARAQKKGNAKAYPVPGYRSYDITMAGVWARLADCVNIAQKEFLEEMPGGEFLPWKVTDVLRYLLDLAGFPASMQDIPDWPLRLWPSDRSSATDGGLILFPADSIAESVNRMTQEYLGAILVWCANSSTYGMWKLLPNRTTPGTPLMNFLLGPAVAGRVPTHVNSYTATQTFIVYGSIVTHVVPPEANYVRVTSAELVPSDVSIAHQVTATLYNPVSFDFVGPTSDPTHPDYLGRFVPIFHVDNTLQTVEAAKYVCRRIFDYACHAQKWVEFEAPYVLVSDPSDVNLVRARPLRVNDPVTIDGESALIRSVNPSWSGGGSDRVRMAHYEALFVS